MYINDFKSNIFSLLNWSISIFLPTFSLVNSSSSFDFILILPFIFPTILIIVVDHQWLILHLLISIVITKVGFRLLEFDWLIRLFINNVSNYNHNFVIFIINTLFCCVIMFCLFQLNLCIIILFVASIFKIWLWLWWTFLDCSYFVMNISLLQFISLLYVWKLRDFVCMLLFIYLFLDHFYI